jgi:hypothetical protein
MQDEQTMHDDDDECRIFSGQGNLCNYHRNKVSYVISGGDLLYLLVISSQAMCLIRGE